MRKAWLGGHPGNGLLLDASSSRSAVEPADLLLLDRRLLLSPGAPAAALLRWPSVYEAGRCCCSCAVGGRSCSAVPAIGEYIPVVDQPPAAARWLGGSAGCCGGREWWPLPRPSRCSGTLRRCCCRGFLKPCQVLRDHPQGLILKGRKFRTIVCLNAQYKTSITQGCTYVQHINPC